MYYLINKPRLPFHLRLSIILIFIYLFLMGFMAPAVGAPPAKIAPPPSIDAYFEKIRGNKAALRAFFTQMPKGGDLHNHLSGAIYAEYFLNVAIDQQLYVNPQTLVLSSEPQTAGDVRIDTFSTSRQYPALKQRLIQDWSIKDFYPGMAAPDMHFFDAFSKFPRLPLWSDCHRALFVLKQRALRENVQYLEIMVGSCPSNFKVVPTDQYEPGLRAAAAGHDSIAVEKTFNEWYRLMQAEAAVNAKEFCDSLTTMHRMGIDDASFTMRYQLSVRREQSPLDIFKALMASFKAADGCPLIGGVNFVSREDGELSMRDYHLHMLMFRYFHQLYPNVPFSLHAGELTLGLVQPEDLTWHINEAVLTAGASRIGHGVDMAFERHSSALMRTMSRNNIAIEINLSSNEFILGVHDDAHPVSLYAENKVPIVISTDDPGILRTDLTEQFVLLALRYHQFRYADIRQFVLNSIRYSFIRDTALKQRLLTELTSRLDAFEKQIVL